MHHSVSVYFKLPLTPDCLRQQQLGLHTLSSLDFNSVEISDLDKAIDDSEEFTTLVVSSQPNTHARATGVALRLPQGGGHRSDYCTNKRLTALNTGKSIV